VAWSAPIAKSEGRVSARDLGAYPVTVALSALTCALAPAYTVRWHIGSYPSTLLEAGIVLSVASFAVESWRLRALPALRSPFTWPAALFLVAAAIAVVVAPDKRAALGIYRAYFVEPIAFYFVVKTIVTSYGRALLLLAGLGVSGLVVALANAAVVLDAMRHHELNAALTAPVAIYMTPNAVPLFLVPLIAVAGSIVLFAEGRRERLLAGAFMVIAVAATLLSFSRGGYLTLAVVAIALAAAHPRRLWLLGGAAAAAIVVIFIPAINRRLAVEVDFTSPSNTLVGRSMLWSATLQMLRGHPIFGAGLSGFAQAIAPIWNPHHSDRFIYPHNFVLTFWSETGLLGLAAFVWTMVKGFIESWRGWRSNIPGWRALELGVFIALIGVIVHGLVDVPYFKNDLSFEFWVLLGLVAAGRSAASARAA